MYDKANPEGYHSVTPSLTVRGGAAAIEFYQRAFDAKVHRRMETPDGKIMHAEILLGDSAVMLGDEMPDWGILSPLSIGGSSCALHIYVTDADAVFAQAIAAGAEVVFPVTDQFWGDRSGRLKDPFGHLWSVATRVEHLSDEEIDRRGQEWLQKGGC
jgi:PhnB protein